MVKLIGALLVLLAGFLIGVQQAARFAARPRQLRQLQHALHRLETEIAYGYTPLALALARTAEATAEPVSSLLRQASVKLQAGDNPTFEASWGHAIAQQWPYTAMKEEERKVVLRLGSTLGISDREDQIKHLRLALLQLKSEEDSAREEQARYEKLSRSLGLLAAALIVILMM